MPNNLVFNQVASELKTAIYGTTDGGTTFTAISVDAGGNVNVSVVNTANVSVVNTANVSVVNTANVSVVNTASVSVVNTANVSVVNSVTHLNDVATAMVELSTASTTGSTLAKDTLGKSMYSYYVYNTSDAAVTVRLQVSPTTENAYYVNDSSDVQVVPASSGKVVLVPKNYLNYTRLSYITGNITTGTVFAYYNAQS